MLLGLFAPHFVDDTDEKAHGTAVGASPDAWKHLPPHRDEPQVQLDVDRSFVYYPNRMLSRRCQLYASLAYSKSN
jgi:hypothetical protein